MPVIDKYKYQKHYREQRIAAGNCPVCGLEKDTERRLCQKCLDKKYQSKVRPTDKQLEEMGFSVDNDGWFEDGKRIDLNCWSYIFNMDFNGNCTIASVCYVQHIIGGKFSSHSFFLNLPDDNMVEMKVRSAFDIHNILSSLSI